MVVAGQPEAAEAGIEILRAGGNAVDAAVACALVQGVVDPLMCGIGGFGSCGIAIARTGFCGYVDFHAPAPLATRPDMWADEIEGETRDGFGFVLRDHVNDIGYQAMCTPVSLRGYWAAQRRHGCLPWQQVVEPAIAWAEDGWTVRPAVEAFWSSGEDEGRVANCERIKYTPASRALYCRADGSPKRIGDRVVNRDLGQTLRLIAKEGPKAFYEGEIAHAMIDDIARHGGLLALDDLHRCEAVANTPLQGTYRNYAISTNRPPGGGVSLLQMLNVAEGWHFHGADHNSADYVRTLAEVMKHATRDEDRFVGDPAFVSVPVEWLASKSYARDVCAEVRAGKKTTVDRLRPSGAASQHTTQVCVVDADRNCATMTHSLGMPSGVITAGLGFMYNGCMAVFDPRPGHAGSLAPGKARFSAIAPSVLFDDHGPHIVVGGPGGPFITMAILQVLLNALDFEMTMLEAVSAPRFYAASDAIDVSNRFTRRVQGELESLGYDVIRNLGPLEPASVYAIRVHPDGLDGGADPGQDGVVLTV
jgi:gamma-glutamyltranspeptidase/glutathione hydrolase